MYIILLWCVPTRVRLCRCTYTVFVSTGLWNKPNGLFFFYCPHVFQNVPQGTETIKIARNGGRGLWRGSMEGRTRKRENEK